MDIWFDDQGFVVVLVGDILGDFYCWVFVQIVDIWFKGQFKIGDFYFVGVFIGGCQVICDCGFYLIDYLVWFVVIYFMCGVNQFCLLWILCYNKLWIDCNVVFVNVWVWL